MREKVLITGGTKGIGLVTTNLFLDAGYEVIVVGRDFKDFLYSNNPNVQMIEYDLSNTYGISTLAEQVGELDILINNAGIFTQKVYSDYQEDDIEQMLNVNLKAPVALITEFAKCFLKKGKGRIVNVASIAAETGHGDLWYGITKAGLVNVTKSFAAILGGRGIVINAVAPGPVETDMIKNTKHSDRHEEIKRRTYLKRHAQSLEVAETIFWLATQSPEFINGETIDINNGARRISF